MAKHKHIETNQLTLPLAPRVKAQPCKEPEKPVSVPTVDPERLESFESIFQALTTTSWKIIWTTNRSTMISYKREKDGNVLRIHKLFARAPSSLVGKIAKTVEGDRRSWHSDVNKFIAAHLHLIEEMTTRAIREPTLDPKGIVYNLQDIFNNLNKRYFDDEIEAKIGWMTPRRRKRSIKLGSYSHQTQAIRVHPALDHDSVPPYVVESVVFHEMVHAQVGIVEQNGRQVLHGDAFYKMLELYPRMAEADAWIDAHHAKLIKRKRRSS